MLIRDIYSSKQSINKKMELLSVNIASNLIFVNEL